MLTLACILFSNQPGC